MSNTPSKLPIYLLIVDDDIKTAETRAKNLEGAFNKQKFDFQCEIAASGENAFEKMAEAGRERYFDVALVDHRLKGMTGIKFSEDLYTVNPWMPVVLFTGATLTAKEQSDIKENTYIYYHALKGTFDDNELALYCLAAILDRDERWQKLFYSLSQQLHSLKQDRILKSCEEGLRRLGYPDYEIAWFEGSEWAGEGSPDVEQLDTVLYRKVLARRRSNAKLGEGRIDGEPVTAGETKDDEGDTASIEFDLDEYKNGILIREYKLIVPLIKEADTSGTDQENDKAVLGELVLYYRLLTPPSQREKLFLEMLGQQLASALANAGTYQQLEDQRSVLNKSIEINHQLLRLLAEEHQKTDNVDDYLQIVLNTFAKAISETLKFKRVCVSIAHESPTKLDKFGIVGLDTTDAKKLRAEGRELVTFTRLHAHASIYDTEAGKIYFIPQGSYKKEEYETEIFFTSYEAKHKWEWHAEDILRTEIVGAGNIVLGYISVDLPADKRRPSTDLFQALRTFATQVATHYTLAIAQRDERIAYDRLQATKDTIVDISAISDLVKLGETIDNNLSKLKFAGDLAIMRYRPENVGAEIEVIYTSPNSRDKNTQDRMSKDQGIVGCVIQSKKPECFASWDQISTFLALHRIRQVGERAESWIGIPLIAEGEPLGALVLQDYTKSNAYSEHDLNSLHTLAAPVALALQRIDNEEENLLKSFRRVSDFAYQLVRWEVDQRQIEEDILREAGELTRADVGVILKLNEAERKLVANTWWWRDGREENEALSLSLKKRGENWPSLSADAALNPDDEGGVFIRNNATDHPLNFKHIPGSKHVVAIPLIIPGDQAHEQRLLGVMTLASVEEAATFHKWHKEPLRMLAAYVVQAHLRSRAKKESDSTIAWAMYNLSAQIFKHSTPLRIGSLLGKLKNMRDDVPKLKSEVEPISIGSNKLIEYGQVDLLRLQEVQIARVIRSFRDEYNKEIKKSYLSKPNIDLINRVPEETTVWTNIYAVNEIVRVLLEDGVRNISKNKYGVGNIGLAIAFADSGVALSVNNSGPKMPDDVLSFIEEGELRFDPNFASLAEVKLLVQAIGATFKVSRNMDERVEVTVVLPQAQLSTPLSLPINMYAEREMEQVQQRVANREALRFAHTIRHNAKLLSGKLDTLEQSISEAITETEVLSDEVRTDIRVKRAVPLYQTLEKVKASQPQLGHHTEDGSITATYTVQVQFPSTPLEDVLVYANDIGLSNMIKEIIKNAREAIEQAGSGEIDINVEISDEAACVHIHNTGSYIEEESQILHEPVNSNKADGKGMDLFMNRLLAEKWDGSLRLTGNYRAATEEHKEGVTFTITMQRVPVSDR